MQHLERHKILNTQHSFGFKSARYYIILIKSYLILYLINEKENEPADFNKTNDVVSFRFGDFQLLDIMKFLVGATTLDPFLKAYNASEMKAFIPY